MFAVEYLFVNVLNPGLNKMDLAKLDMIKVKGNSEVED